MADTSKQYDAADWYYDEAFQATGLPEQHTAHHIVYFMRWLEEKGALTDEFWSELDRGARTFPADLSPWGDIAFIDYMVKPEWRPFVEAYYGAPVSRRYLEDYSSALQGKLPTTFHIRFTDEGYAKLRPELEERLAEWRANPKIFAPPAWVGALKAVNTRFPKLTAVVVVVGFLLALGLIVGGAVYAIRFVAHQVGGLVRGTALETPLIIACLLGVAFLFWWALRKKKS